MSTLTIDMIREAQRKLEESRPNEPRITMIHVGNLERFIADVEKRTGSVVVKDEGKKTPYPAYLNGTPLEEKRHLDDNLVLVWAGDEIWRIIDLDEQK